MEITWSDSQFSYYSTDGSTVTVSANGTWLSSEITVPSKVSHSSEYTVTAIGNAKNSSGLIIGGAAAAVIVIAAIGLLYFRMHR